MRVVLDTNVHISGLLLPKSTPGRILRAWSDGQFTVVTSEPLLVELARVLNYPKIQRRIGWRAEVVDRYISILRFRTEVVVPDLRQIQMSGQVRDRDDEMVLGTFLTSGADLMISGDQDLLALLEHYPIETPDQFIHRL